MKRLITGALAAVIAFSAAGCAGMKTRETVVEGRYIDRETVRQIRAGETTRDSILRAFGEPTSVERKGGQEVFIYKYEKRDVPQYMGGMIENEAGAVKESSTLEVVIKDGVVERYSFTSEK